MDVTANAHNLRIAALLDRVGDLLDAQRANPFRARAYHAGAQSVRELDRPAAEILDKEGEAGLQQLPRIGPSIARAISEIARSGQLRMLDRLQGDMCPEDLLCSVPGIGRTLARRIHETLGIDSLEALEIAAHDGRLASVPGMGRRRLEGLREVLASLLRRGRYRATPSQSAGAVPSVATLLEIDARYRQAAARDELHKIAPRRFNPTHEAWLPVLHAELDDWHFTALYSNTARAHELGQTRDWVVLFYEREGREDQCTVVTERRGPLAGSRVVRGREPECERYYRAPSPAPPSGDAVSG
jgi:DNA polymerase (family 10)